MHVNNTALLTVAASGGGGGQNFSSELLETSKCVRCAVRRMPCVEFEIEFCVVVLLASAARDLRSAGSSGVVDERVCDSRNLTVRRTVPSALLRNKNSRSSRMLCCATAA